MALQLKKTTEHGIGLETAYIRIDELSGSKDRVILRVRTYTDHTNFILGRTWIEESIYTFSPLVDDVSLNFIKQGYEYLKTLEEYSESVDILENMEVSGAG